MGMLDPASSDVLQHAACLRWAIAIRCIALMREASRYSYSSQMSLGSMIMHQQMCTPAVSAEFKGALQHFAGAGDLLFTSHPLPVVLLHPVVLVRAARAHELALPGAASHILKQPRVSSLEGPVTDCALLRVLHSAPLPS